MKPILTVDQRWLLRSVGGHKMRDCMIGPDGVSRLMESMYSSSGHPIDGGPAWLADGFECVKSKVVSKRPPIVSVTVVQINRYAAQLDAALKAELVECRRADRAEAERVWKWCRCGREAECLRANQGDPLYGNRYHPSEAEELEHYEECWRIRGWTDDLLDRALGFEIAGGQLGQLELFEVSA